MVTCLETSLKYNFDMPLYINKDPVCNSGKNNTLQFAEQNGPLWRLKVVSGFYIVSFTLYYCQRKKRVNTEEYSLLVNIL